MSAPRADGRTLQLVSILLGALAILAVGISRPIPIRPILVDMAVGLIGFLAALILMVTAASRSPLRGSSSGCNFPLRTALSSAIGWYAAVRMQQPLVIYFEGRGKDIR
jgi:hypothetical protein